METLKRKEIWVDVGHLQSKQPVNNDDIPAYPKSKVQAVARDYLRHLSLMLDEDDFVVAEKGMRKAFCLEER